MRQDVWFAVSTRNRLHAFENVIAGQVEKRMSLCGSCWSDSVSRPIDIKKEQLSRETSLCSLCMNFVGLDEIAVAAWKPDYNATVANDESSVYGWLADDTGATEHAIKGELTLCGKMYPVGVARYDKPEKPDMLCRTCTRVQQIAIYTGVGRFVSFNGKYLIWAEDMEIEVDENEVYGGGHRQFRAIIRAMPPRSPIPMPKAVVSDFDLEAMKTGQVFAASDGEQLPGQKFLVPQNPLKGVVVAAPAPLNKPQDTGDNLPPGMKEYMSAAVGLMAGKLTESRPELLPGDNVYFDRMGALEIPGLENLWIVEGVSILFQDKEVSF